MILTMKRHASRPDSGSLQFKLRVPADVVERVRSRVVTVELPGTATDPVCLVSFRLGEFAKTSLRTRDAATADTRRLVIIATLSKLYAAVRNGPAPLNRRQIVALSGEVYRHLVAEHGDDAGTPQEWEAWKSLLRAAAEGRIPGAPAIPVHGRTDERIAADLLFGEDDLTETINALPADYDSTALRQRVGQLAFWVLGRHGIEIDSETHLRLLQEIARAALEAGWRLKRMASGDYRPDPAAERFPAFQDRTAGVTLTEIFDRWAKETKPAPSTLSTWTGILGSFRAHLKHDDARRVSDQDVVAWKDSRIAAGRALKTVADSDLACLKTLFRYAKANRLLTTNPVEGVRVTVKRKAGARMLGYSDTDVARLLDLASRETHPARRWLPWLAALTGARIGELAALWGTSVIEKDGVVGIEIAPSPDGSTLKNEGSERFVPLHPEIIRQGFVTWAKAKGRAPLFYAKPAKANAQGRHPSKGVTNHLAAWIREQGFTNVRIAPAHGLRHFFKTTASLVGIADSLADAIQGHADQSSSGTYRHVKTAQIAEAIGRFPVPTVTVEADGAMPALVEEI